MLSRNFLIAAAAAALAATPVLAQQSPKPTQTVAAMSRDTTHAAKRTAHRAMKTRSAKAATMAKPATPATPAAVTGTTAKPAEPATPASPSVKAARQTTPVKHKVSKRSVKKSKKPTADSTKKS